MDIANHSIWAGVIGYKMDLPIEYCIASGIVAAMPDIIGWLGGSSKGEWSWYNWAHKLNIFWLLPPYLLHVLMDIPAHIKDKKYWWHCNIISWIGLILIWSI